MVFARESSFTRYYCACEENVMHLVDSQLRESSLDCWIDTYERKSASSTKAVLVLHAFGNTKCNQRVSVSFRVI